MNKKLFKTLAAVVFLCGLISFGSMIYLVNQNNHYKEIIFEGRNVNSDVCNGWNNLTAAEKEMSDGFYFEGTKIPSNVIADICEAE